MSGLVPRPPPYSPPPPPTIPCCDCRWGAYRPQPFENLPRNAINRSLPSSGLLQKNKDLAAVSSVCAVDDRPYECVGGPKLYLGRRLQLRASQFLSCGNAHRHLRFRPLSTSIELMGGDGQLEPRARGAVSLSCPCYALEAHDGPV